MNATVTRMPTRAEMRLRRSAAKHASRIASAQTPQQVLAASADEVRAFMAHSNPALAAQVAQEATAALSEILNRARVQVGRGASRHVA